MVIGRNVQRLVAEVLKQPRDFISEMQQMEEKNVQERIQRRKNVTWITVLVISISYLMAEVVIKQRIQTSLYDLESYLTNVSFLVVDCVWSQFGNWSECSKTCGGGKKTSKRKIITEAIGGGKDCDGDNTKVESCNEQPCPGRLHIRVIIMFESPFSNKK